MTKPCLTVFNAVLFAAFALFCGHAPAAESPNVLFVIADDASRHFGQAYGCDWVKTPNIDRLAKAGLVFDNVYVPTSKCAPCRAAIVTGRNPWQNGEAANHQNYFPAERKAFGEALSKAGVFGGSSGKVWGPGIAKGADGNTQESPGFLIPGTRSDRV